MAAIRKSAVNVIVGISMTHSLQLGQARCKIEKVASLNGISINFCFIYALLSMLTN